MKNISKTGITLLALLAVVFAKAQDTRFSQTLNNPLWFNPAAMDLTDDVRLNLNYRNQWATIADGYSTYAGTITAPVYLKSKGDSTKSRSRLDLGLNITDDKSGGFNRVDATFSFGFGLKLNEANIITAALNIGFVQYSFAAMNQSFDEQYVYGAYDPNAATGESLTGKKTAPDVGLGFLWHYAPENNKLQVFAGVAGFHVNQPNMSLNNGDGKLPARFDFQAGVKIIGNKVDFSPVVFYDLQGPFNQFIGGLLIDYKFGAAGKLNLGVYYKQGDAIPVQIGYNFKFLYLAYSYDFGISQLARTTPGLMTHEVTLALSLYDMAAKKGVRRTSFY